MPLCSQGTAIIFGSSSIIFSNSMPFVFSYSNISLVSLRVCQCLFVFFSSNSYLLNNSYKFYFRCSSQRLSVRLPGEDIMLGLYWRFHTFNSSTDLPDRAT